MAESRRPSLGQRELPGLETNPALVHILTPEFTGLNPEDFADITPEVLEFAAPDKLRPYLIDVDPNGRSTIGYYPGGWQHHRRLWLAVSPAEYVEVSRHVELLGKAAVNRTLKKYTKAEQRTDEVQATATRASMHAAAVKLPLVVGYIEDTSRRLHLISSFYEMAEHPNLNRAGLLLARRRFTALRDDVIDDMVFALGNQKEWTEAQSKLAERAIVKRTYLADNRHERYQNFSDMLGLCSEYYGHKLAMFIAKRDELQQYIHDRTRNTDGVR